MIHTVVSVVFRGEAKHHPFEINHRHMEMLRHHSQCRVQLRHMHPPMLGPQPLAALDWSGGLHHHEACRECVSDLGSKQRDISHEAIQKVNWECWSLIQCFLKELLLVLNKTLQSPKIHIPACKTIK